MKQSAVLVFLTSIFTFYCMEAVSLLVGEIPEWIVINHMKVSYLFRLRST